MTLEDIKKNPVFLTGAISKTYSRNDNLKGAVMKALARFYSGDFGQIPAEDRESNLDELEAGQGRIVARYGEADGFQEDIYIIAYFSDRETGIDYNHTAVLYTADY